MEYAEHGQDVQYYEWNENTSYRWYARKKKLYRMYMLILIREYPSANWHSYGLAWDWNHRTADCSGYSPTTSIPRSDVLSKYIMIQPRGEDDNFRDRRMLFIPGSQILLI